MVTLLEPGVFTSLLSGVSYVIAQRTPVEVTAFYEVLLLSDKGYRGAGRNVRKQ